MMHAVFSYTAVFLLLGSGGMHMANRLVEAETRRQRWLKFGTYIVIVGGAIATILVHQFSLFALLVSAMGLWEILSHVEKLSERRSRAIAVGVYVAIVTAFILFATQSAQPFLLFLYFQVFIFDGFSQVFGQLFGKRKILPTISPGKTLEGLIGGTAFSSIAAISARSWVACSTQEALIAGLFTASLSFGGDVLASYFKRRVNTKDYSQLIPGHGGVLDRFDSLLMTGAGYTLFSLFQLFI